MTLTKESLLQFIALGDRATPGEVVHVEWADFENGKTYYELHALSDDEKEAMFVAFSTESHTPPMRAKFNAEFWLAALTTGLEAAREVIRLREAIIGWLKDNEGECGCGGEEPDGSSPTCRLHEVLASIEGKK